MENRKMLMQKGLKLLKVLSTGDKTERAETLYAQQITRSPCQSTAVFRFNPSN
jgi:hypothetical protein